MECFMNLVQYFRDLFSYNDWANREVLRALETSEDRPERSVSRFAHILSAERLWLERLQSQKQSYPVWPEFDLTKARSEVTELAKLWKDYLDSTDESALYETITYRNTKGESWTDQKQHVLTHLVMHSAYHRGQIAADMRSAGLTPAYTDFIHAVRQGFLK
jgi:uncharacterized damage-inducible protein DinB